LLVSRERGSLFKKEIAMPAFRMSPFEKILFFRNLSAMVSAGLSLNESLYILEEQVRSHGVKKAIRQMAKDVANGQTLSHAMSKHKRFFSEYLVESVNLGEVAGALTDTLDRISVDLEKNYELRRKVYGAIAYPLTVIAVMIIVVITLMVYVLPKIAELFSEVDADLPLPTQVLLSASNFIGSHPFLLSTIVIVSVIGFMFSLKIEKVRLVVHGLILRTPILGGLILEYNLAQFFRSLESLVVSGTSLVKSVEVAKKTLRNKQYHRALTSVHRVILHGVPLSEALKPHRFLFPTQTQRIIKVGEQTGRFEETFKRVTDYFERSVNHKTQMLTVLIEPILMIVIGVVVGGLALSIFLPIYQISTVL
jgi:type IV pilus assembly protein PilC